MPCGPSRDKYGYSKYLQFQKTNNINKLNFEELLTRFCVILTINTKILILEVQNASITITYNV